MDRSLTTTSSSNAVAGPSKPQVSLNRQIVLEEDEYTEALSAIIARDFFPSLVHLDARNQYLSALESQDPSLITATARRLVDLANAPTPTPRSRVDGRTPYVNFPSDTPFRTPRQHPEPPPAKKPKYDPTLSLDQFQARYTSEDNASFTEILDDENRKRRENYAWAWNAQDRANSRSGNELEGREKLLLDGAPVATGIVRRISGGDTKAITQHGERVASDQGVGTDNERGHTPDTGEIASSTAQNGTEDGGGVPSRQLILKDSSGSDALPPAAPEQNRRPAGVHAWKFKTRNALMFPPDADLSPYHPQDPLDSSDGNIQGDRAAPTVVYANTRLPEQAEDEIDGKNKSDTPPSPTRSRIAAAISGEPYVPRDASPKVRGFGFVDAIPSPTPADLGADRLKELMTLGTLLATPRVISGSDDPDEAVNSPFVIKPPNARDMLGRRLGNEAGRALSRKAGLLGGATPRTPNSVRKDQDKGKTVTSTPRRIDILTPAARRLLDKTKSGAGLGSSATASSSGRRGQGVGTTPIIDSRQRIGKPLDLRKVGWDSPRVSR
ncbi:hypothetical protein FRB99_007405 [Tulasnella sp. 403]|nr:hypothetical protein FRB99_007405 [Tulasnella sp. 403]